MSSRSPAGRLLGNGKYEILAQIGSGAMGSVWLGKHIALDRVVAVKLLAPTVGGTGAEANERFLSEARTASLLRHRNSVQILDYGAEGDDRWIVMEFLEGMNLAEVLAAEPRLPPRRAIAIAAQILAAVAEAHEYGIVHRDLKPANIMLVPWTDDDGHETELVKVLDFGIATLASEDNSSGEVAGTPEYMSPEQAQGLSVDPRSDVYAVGVVLYQMLVGDVPFHGATPLDTMLAHVSQAPRAARTLDPAISESLEGVLMRALEKGPDARHANARAFRAALLELPEARGLQPDSKPSLAPVHTVPPVAQARTKRRVWLFALVLTLLTGGTAALIALGSAGPETTELASAGRALRPLETVPPARLSAASAPAVPVGAVETADAADAIGPDAASADARSADMAEAGPSDAASPDATVASGPDAIALAKVTEPAPKPKPAEPKRPDAARERVSDAKTSPAPAPAQAAPLIAEQPAEAAPKPVEAPVAPAPAPPRPALAAGVAIQGLAVQGSLPRSAFQRALDAARPALEQCYRTAAQAAQKDLGGNVSASVVIDVDGQVTQVTVGAFALPGFSGCARAALSRTRSRERPDTGTCSATFVLAVTPKPPEPP